MWTSATINQMETVQPSWYAVFSSWVKSTMKPKKACVGDQLWEFGGYKLRTHTVYLRFCFNSGFRVPKCDVIENEVCEIMGFVKLFWKNNFQDAYSPKISNLGQIVSEILAQLCSDDSIQILLNLTWFLILWTKPNLEGFVWNRHSITGLISQRQFAPNWKGQEYVFIF